MKSALIIITEKILNTGMSKDEVDHLLALFLQEEAFDFIKYIHSCMNEYELYYDSGFKSSNLVS